MAEPLDHRPPSRIGHRRRTALRLCTPPPRFKHGLPTTDPYAHPVMSRSFIRPGRAVLAALATVATLAACGGGGSSAPSAAVPSAASTPVGLNGPAGSTQSIAFPSTGGYSGTMLLTLANAANGVSTSVSAGTSPPPGAPVPAGTDQALLFVGLSTSASVALTGFPAFTFAVPDSALQSIRRSPQSGSFNLLLNFFDPGNPAAGYQFAQTCSVSGSTVTCAGGNVLFNLLAQLQYVFELVLQEISPSGGVAVFVVPTPAPIVCSPTSDIVGVNQTNIIDCTAQGFGGAFAISVADPTIASVQLADSATFTFFSVTGLRAGTTTLSLRSQPGGTGSVAITVAQ